MGVNKMTVTQTRKKYSGNTHDVWDVYVGDFYGEIPYEVVTAVIDGCVCIQSMMRVLYPK